MLVNIIEFIEKCTEIEYSSAHVFFTYLFDTRIIHLKLLLTEKKVLTLGFMLVDLKTKPVKVYQNALDKVILDECPSPLEACRS